jgi:hypothetical protein
VDGSEQGSIQFQFEEVYFSFQDLKCQEPMHILHSAYTKNNNLKKCAGMGLNGFRILDKYSASRTIEKMKIVGAVLELTAKQQCQSSNLGQIGQISSAD